MNIFEVPGWIQNLPERKKQLGVSAASVIAGVAILIGYFQSGPNALNYAEAETAVAKWSASPGDGKLYLGMKEALRQVPDLGVRYEASIAQNLMNTDQLDKALVMANRALSRVEQDIPYHAHFAKTSLLIEQEDFQKALEASVALKEQMGSVFLESHQGGSLLYVHNLLRIACLQQELQNRFGEKAAWEELEGFLNGKSKLAEKFLASFSEKQVDLTQYITERMKSL